MRYRPAARDAEVGGDWYDAFVATDHVPCVVIGDVSGHDRDAAAAMGQMRNLLRGIGYTLGEPPAAVFSALDRALEDLAVGSLATAVLARLLPAADGDGCCARPTPAIRRRCCSSRTAPRRCCAHPRTCCWVWTPPPTASTTGG